MPWSDNGATFSPLPEHSQYLAARYRSSLVFKMLSKNVAKIGRNYQYLRF